MFLPVEPEPLFHLRAALPRCVWLCGGLVVTVCRPDNMPLRTSGSVFLALLPMAVCFTEKGRTSIYVLGNVLKKCKKIH